MQLYYDQDLEKLQNEVQWLIAFLSEEVMAKNAFVDQDVVALYSDEIEELDRIKEKLKLIAGKLINKRTAFHRLPSFNEEYYKSYGQLHPEAEGILKEEDFL